MLMLMVLIDTFLKSVLCPPSDFDLPFCVSLPSDLCAAFGGAVVLEPVE